MGLEITVAFAQSLDGSLSLNDPAKVNNPENRLILSCHDSMVQTHKIRSCHCAILVGINTILADNPLLTVRYHPDSQVEQQPIPIILDYCLRTPENAKVLTSHPKSPIIFCGPPEHDKQLYFSEKRAKLESKGAIIVESPPSVKKHVDLHFVKRHCESILGLKKIMVEGGVEIITSFIENGLFDRIVITVCPVLIANGKSLFKLDKRDGIKVDQVKLIGKDVWMFMSKV